MSSARTTASNWLRLVALCPLATIGLEWADALVLGGVQVLTLLVVGTGLRLLRSWSTGEQQPVIAALMAAIVIGVCDLSLQALCHAHLQTLQPFLPLPIITAVVFCRIEPESRWMSASRDAALRGAAFTVALLIGAALHALLPSEAAVAASLVVAGLLLAIIERATPVDPASEASTSTPRTRARVTGPVR